MLICGSVHRPEPNHLECANLAWDARADAEKVLQIVGSRRWKVKELLGEVEHYAAPRVMFDLVNATTALEYALRLALEPGGRAPAIPKRKKDAMGDPRRRQTANSGKES